MGFKNAALGIFGIERGNTKEMWELIFWVFFIIYSSQLLLAEWSNDPCCPGLGLLIIFMFLYNMYLYIYVHIS